MQSQNQGNNHSKVYLTVSILAGILWGFATYECFYNLETTNTLTGVLDLKHTYNYAILLPTMAVGGILAGIIAIKASLNSKESVKIFTPLFLYTPFLFINLNLFSVFAYIILSSLFVLRLTAQLYKTKSDHFKTIDLSFKNGLLIVITGSLLSIMYAYLLQTRLYQNLYFTYQDWGIFLNVADNTLRGKWFFNNVLGINFFSQHFMPGAFLILCPYVFIFHSVNAFFLLAALAVYSPAPILYCYAVQKGVKPYFASIYSILWLLLPSMANMIPAIFYGFHAIYLVMPVIALYFLLDSKGNKRLSWILFLFSLTIKETVAIFWIGLGFVYILQGRKKDALWMISVSAAYFLLCLKVIIPWISGDNYMYTNFYYSKLGTSISEIMLSPFTKPDIFWTRLFSVSNIHFSLLLIIPLIWPLLCSPIYLIAVIPIFSAVCLKDDLQLSTIHSWYQSEILIILFITAISGFINATASKSSKYSKKMAELLSGISSIKATEEKTLQYALTAATGTTAILCFYFFSMGCFPGKSKWADYIHVQPLTELTDSFKRVIPEKEAINATSHLAAQFILRNDVYPCHGTSYSYVLFDLADEISDSTQVEIFRKNLLESGHYKCIFYRPFGDSVFAFFKKTNSINKIPVLPKISDEEWKHSGNDMEISEPALKCKIEYKEPPESTLMIHLRVTKKVNYDVIIKVNVFSKSAGSSIATFAFGNARTPLYKTSPGDLFTISMKIPQDTVGIKIAALPRTVITE